MVTTHQFNNSLHIFLLVIFGYLVAYSTVALPQIQKDFEFIIQNNPIDGHEHKENLSFKMTETSEIKMLAMGMIRFYQNFISSQQDNRITCVFTPSCSRFGFAAIQKYGAFYGILITSDRLQRCNSFALSHRYPIDLQSGKLIDPIEPYFMKIKLR